MIAEELVISLRDAEGHGLDALVLGEARHPFLGAGSIHLGGAQAKVPQGVTQGQIGVGAVACRHRKADGGDRLPTTETSIEGQAGQPGAFCHPQACGLGAQTIPGGGGLRVVGEGVCGELWQRPDLRLLRHRKTLGLG